MLARQIALGFGVAAVVPMLLYYGMGPFTTAPKRSDHTQPMVHNRNITLTERAAQQRKAGSDNAAYDE